MRSLFDMRRYHAYRFDFPTCKDCRMPHVYTMFEDVPDDILFRILSSLSFQDLARLQSTSIHLVAKVSQMIYDKCCGLLESFNVEKHDLPIFFELLEDRGCIIRRPPHALALDLVEKLGFSLVEEGMSATKVCEALGFRFFGDNSPHFAKLEKPGVNGGSKKEVFVVGTWPEGASAVGVLTEFPTTMLMNFISGDGFYSLYPGLTSAGKGYLNLPLDVDLDEVVVPVLGHLKEAGFQILPDPKDAIGSHHCGVHPYCPGAPRRFPGPPTLRADFHCLRELHLPVGSSLDPSVTGLRPNVVFMSRVERKQLSMPIRVATHLKAMGPEAEALLLLNALSLGLFCELEPSMVSRRVFVLSALLSIAFEVNAVPSTWVPAAQRRQAGQVITQCTVPGTVAMTFDDGPYEYTKEIVDLLKSYDATATFFFSEPRFSQSQNAKSNPLVQFADGNNYDCIYDYASSQRVKYVYKNGMHVASHTWSHGDLASMDSRHIHQEMYRLEKALMKIVGVTPAFMRPPYGSYNSYVLDAAYMRGQAVVMWDFDSEDSMGATPEESIRSYEQKIGEHPGTMLLLNHETYGTTARQVLPAILPQLKEAGYRIVDVATCLGLPQYQEVTTPSPRDLWTKTAKASFVLPHFSLRTSMFETSPRGNPKGSISDAEVNQRPVITVDGSMILESPFSEHLKSNYIPSYQETPVIRQILCEQDAIIRDLDVEYQDIEEAVSKLYERQRQILSKTRPS
ncbi:hypothetical protein NMY22_g18989 [Coprinellus aureogranulatus]|nr:hypothetical protein NMY22_g18989 [Coprinellus aureogranulatus]